MAFRKRQPQPIDEYNATRVVKTLAALNKLATTPPYVTISGSLSLFDDSVGEWPVGRVYYHEATGEYVVEWS